MKVAVSHVLNSVLGTWIENFNPEQLELSIFSGQVTLSNIILKESSIDSLGFPFKMHYGYIQSLYISIPWSSLSSSPLKIKISGIYGLISPIPPDSWSEEKQISKSKHFKKTILENFEAITNSEITIKEDQNFISKLIKKIILNVQVKIKKIYFRYEDGLKDTKAFSVGFIVKSLRIQSCDENWKSKFIDTFDISYKLLEIEGISLFLDYQTCLSSTDMSFPSMIIKELQGQIEHKHILSPTTFTMKLQINKNPKNLSIPQYSLSIENPQVNISIEVQQLQSIIRVLEFLQAFSHFKKSIKKYIKFPNIQGEQAQMYKDLYKEYRLLLKNTEKAKKISKKLAKIEEDYDVYSIIGQRKVVDKELEIMKKTQGLAEDLKKTESEVQEGGFNRFISFFWKKSEVQKRQDNEKLMGKINELKSRLQEIIQEKKAFAEEMEAWVASEQDFSIVPKEFIKNFLHFHIETTNFVLKHQDEELLMFKMHSFDVKIGMRTESVFCQLAIHKTVIYDKVANSPVFKYIFKSKPLKIEFESLYGKKLSLYSEGVIYIINLISFLKVYKIFSSLWANTSKGLKKKYLKQISETSSEYIKLGEEYIKSLISTGTTAPIELDINIKGPIFCFPLNICSKVLGMLVVDLGRLQTYTKNFTENDLEYCLYNFLYTSLRVCVVWDFDHIKSWAEGNYTEIVSPVDWNLQIKACKNTQFVVPSIEGKILFPKISISIHDEVLKFLLILKKLALATFDNVRPDYITKKTKKFEYYSTKTQMENEVLETEGYKDQMKKIHKVVKMTFEVLFEEIELNLVENGKPLCGIQVLKVKTQIVLSVDGDIALDFTLGRFELEDYRDGIKLNKVVCNPLLYEVDGKNPLGVEKILQVKVSILLKPKSDILEISVYINDMRLILSYSLLKTIKNFFIDTIKSISPSSTPTSSFQQKPEKYVYETTFHTKLVFQLTNFELWLPLSLTKTEKRVGCFNFGAFIDYTSSKTYKISFDENKEEIAINYIFLSNEASITLTHIGGLIGLVNKNRVVLSEERTYDLFPSSRIGMYYLCTKPKGNPIEMKLSINFESYQMGVGFRDIQYIKNLIKKWLPDYRVKDSSHVDIPKVKTKLQVFIECNTFKATLLEDTGVKAYALLSFQMNSFKLNVNYDVETIEGSLSSFIYADYYNLKMCTWEPLIENWDFHGTLEKFSYESPIILKFESQTVLNINITMSLIENIGTLLQKLGENSVIWAKSIVNERVLTDQNEVLAHRQFYYAIENDLGTSAQVWLDLPNTEVDIWTLNSGQSQIFTYDELQEKVNMSILKNGLSNGITDDIQVPIGLCLKIEGYDLVKGLYFERIGIRGFELVSTERKLSCILNVVSKDNMIVVKIESGKYCMNNGCSSIVVFCGHGQHEIEAGRFWALPLRWTYDLNEPKVLTKGGLISFFDNKSIELITGDWAIITVCEFKTETKEKQLVAQFNIPFCFENLMPGLMKVYANKSEHFLGIGNAGSSVFCSKLNPNLPYEFSFRFEFDSELHLQTEWKTIGNKKSSVRYTGNFPGKDVKVNPTVLDVKKNKSVDFSLRDKARKKVQDEIYAKNVEVYSKYIIINKTEFDLDIKSSTSSLTLQHNSMCFFKSKRIKLMIQKFKHGEPSELSKTINIDTIGISGCIILPLKKPSFFSPKQVSLGLSVSSASKPLLKTKIVTIVPRFIITNKLPFEIFIRQFTKNPENNSSHIIKTDATQTYYLDNYDISKQVQVSRNNIDWSTNFNIQNIEDFQIKIKAKIDEYIENLSNEWYKPQFMNNYNHIVRVIVTTEDQATIIIILTTPIEPEFAINNRTDEPIKLKQKKLPVFEIPANTRIPWVFDCFGEEKRAIEFTIGEITREVKIEKVKKPKKFSKYQLETRVVGITREVVVNIIRNSEDPWLENEKDKWKYKCYFCFKGIGVSIINSTPKELFYFSALNITSSYKERDRLNKKRLEKHKVFKLRVGKLQLDNMQAKKKYFPVILGPSLEKDENVPMFQLEIDRTIYDKIVGKGVFEKDVIKRFSWFEIAFQEIRVNVNQEIANMILEFSAEVVKKLVLVKPFEGFPNSVVDIKLICPGLDPSPIKLSKNITNPSNKSYIKLLHLCAVKIIISFKPSKKDPKHKIDPREGSGQLNLLSTIGNSFINISNSPLYFKEIFIHESFQTLSNLSKMLISNYKRQGILQIYKILGSSDLIGNPVGLIDKLGTGVLEFINEPVKGIIKGPKAFAEGIKKGIRSLVGGIVAGSFESVSKITGNLYELVKEVGGDKQSAKRVNESEDALENILQGFKGGVMDLATGVTGVFLKPWKGAKQQGPKGLIKGLGSGILGIMISPLTAALRIGSGLTSGVSNVATFLSKGKITPLGRVRFPRHFSPRMVLEKYSHHMAEAQDYLMSFSEHKKQSIVLFLSMVEDQNIIVIITLKSLLFIVDAELIKNFELEKIDSVEVHLPADNNFYIRIACGNDERLVICSKNYGYVAKLYAALLSLTKPAVPRNGVKKLIGSERYGEGCCKPRNKERKMIRSRFTLVQKGG